MLQRTILGALATAAVVGGVLIVKALKKTDDKPEETEEGIHFMSIDEVAGEPEETKASPGMLEAVAEICGVYPYLTPDFVEGILDAGEALNKQFEEDVLVAVVHSAVFPNEELKKSFLEIMDANGYDCEYESGSEVKVSKKLFTENDAIISDILNTANQVYALKGVYGDYEVID